MIYLWQILAPGLVMAIAIVGTGGALSFAGRWTSWAVLGSSEVQRLLLASVLVLALLLNANGWVAGRYLFPVLLAVGSMGAFLAVLRWRNDPLAHAVLWSMLVGWLCISVLVAAWHLAFVARHLWMLEGTNHDLVFFYGGAHWAFQHPLDVNQDAVARAWGLGRCGQGMQFIGDGCVVQRGGAYTLLALASSLVPDPGPNQVRSMVGIGALFPLLGLLPGLAGRFGSGRWWPRGGALTVLLVMLCMSCTGLMLAVVNENIGTALAAALLAAVVMWGLAPMVSLPVKWVILGASAGCAGIVYGEAAVHACLVVAVSVVVTARRVRSWRMFLVGAALTFAAFALVLNRHLPELFASYRQVSGIVSQGDWPSWYMHQPWWSWLGAPFGGLLMTAQPPVTTDAVAIGMVLMLVVTYLAAREQRWRFFCGLLLISALMVGYIQWHGYQYGEHKLIQVLGPAWAALLAWLLARRAQRRHSLALVLLVIAVTYALSAAYAVRARAIIVSHAPAALTHALAEALRLPQPGEEVIIDAAAVRGPQKYVKQDFAIIELHQRGARARLAASGQLPEGYSDALFEGTLTKAHSPDWLLVLKQPGANSATRPATPPVREDATFAMYSLRDGQLPSVVAGKGWHQCEQQHCWTSGAFTVEVVVPPDCKNSQLVLDVAPFQPPSDGRIDVIVNGATRAVTDFVQRESLTVPLGAGSSTVMLRPNWQVKSPQALGLSSDGRQLFASVSGAQVHCGLALRGAP